MASRLTIPNATSVICSIGLVLLPMGLLLMEHLPTSRAKWGDGYQLRPFRDAEQHCDNDGGTHRT